MLQNSRTERRITMSRRTEKEARNTLRTKTGADKVLSVYEGRDYWEFDTRTGGDLVRYRVYDDSKITER